MAKISAGLLLFRSRGAQLEVFLVHPGGPFWRKKEEGAWSIPKGEVSSGEPLLAAAQREFLEETGARPEGEFIELGKVEQRGGKTVWAWAVRGDFCSEIRSNTFEMEWPPRSGRIEEFPEVDRAEWFSLTAAETRIQREQRAFLDRLGEYLRRRGEPDV
jgi:predicted NUDIX family NTP pyrophosphohydrolase